MTASERNVEKIVRGQATSDGAGVKLTRVIGTHRLPDLDPFLMLDEFGSDDPQAYLAGFPDHPHRGFETVTYMLAGRMRHGDNKGNVGLLEPGSVQWMTAGRGIVHSEMPEQEEGLMRGFQLWVNLPARDKMCAPRYQDIPPAAIPVFEPGDGNRVKIIAGRYAGIEGPVSAVATEPLYLDVHLVAQTALAVPVAADHAGFVYVYEGGAVAGDKPLAKGELGVLGAGDRLTLRTGDEPARLLVVAGKKLDEPVAKYGPFVMNTQAELHQAVADYRAGRF
ncbi:MAG: pirin family protein [Magnetospirillum sp.]|jgi:redox-sensitive bicupin YhaK (pirin superfamily)|nr:pirin family protein [Magnetospirillum sp.]